MRQKPYSILVVDDEPANARLLAHILRGSSQIQIATSGSQALAIANSDARPDLVLLDVVMPDIDGYEVCRRLKANPRTKDITVIFVTAMDDIAAEELGLNLGAVDYITKPLHPAIVRARVRHHMNVKIKTDMLEALSYIDGLTHVSNRRRFDESLAAAWAEGLVTERPLAVIMIDFDHFKALNDHYGHGRGDLCLQQGATALQEALRQPRHLVARYGGEEFVVLLPDCDAAQAAAIAETMRLAVDALGFEHNYSTVADHVTVSLGVSAMIPRANATPHLLLETADQALGQAKRDGRNQVRVAEQPTVVADIEADAARTEVPARTFRNQGTRWNRPATAFPAPPTEPLARTAEEETPPERYEFSPWSQVGESTHHAQNRRLRVLLVDDHPTNQIVARGILNKLGVGRTDVVSNGREALSALAREAYDLVLMDIDMPVMDGLEATRAIRAGLHQVLDARVQIIAMTGLDSNDDQERCVQAGMDGYLTKPLQPQRLAELIALLSSQRSAPETPPQPQSEPQSEPHAQENTLAPSSAPDLTAPIVIDLEGVEIFQEQDLLERMMQDRPLAEAVIQQFLQDVPQRIQDLHAALARGDAAEVAFKAHSIKGLAGNISAPRLRNVAAALEALGSSGDPAASAAITPRLDAEFEQLKASLARWMAG